MHVRLVVTPLHWVCTVSYTWSMGSFISVIMTSIICESQFATISGFATHIPKHADYTTAATRNFSNTNERSKLLEGYTRAAFQFQAESVLTSSCKNHVCLLIDIRRSPRKTEYEGRYCVSRFLYCYMTARSTVQACVDPMSRLLARLCSGFEAVSQLILQPVA